MKPGDSPAKNPQENLFQAQLDQRAVIRARFQSEEAHKRFSCALRNWLSGLVFKPLTGLQTFRGCFGAV